jgi:hypothetical protein
MSRFGRTVTFDCRALQQAIEETNYGKPEVLARRLGATTEAVTLSLLQGRRCAHLGDAYRRRRDARKAKHKAARCKNILRLLAAGRVSATDKQYLREYCAADQVAVAESYARGRRRVAEPDCRSRLAALRKHGTYTGAAKELGVSYNTIKFGFFGQRVYFSREWQPGRCAQFAPQAARALRGGRG